MNLLRGTSRFILSRPFPAVLEESLNPGSAKFIFIRIIVAGIFFVLHTAACAQTSEMMYYKLWGSFDGRHEYEVQLFKLAMDLTASEYPPYVLTQYNFPMSSQRGRREVARGDKVNFYVAPPRSPGDELYEEVVSIPVPIMKGLLGYRKLLVDVNSMEAFAGIKHVGELKKFKVGQARGWPDVRIYKHAGFRIEDSAQFVELFSMLDQGRFDFLPLGIMEADKALQTYDKDSANLIALDSLYIYYPWPAVFQVRAQETLLIERLRKGLERAQESGAMDKLFNTFFADALAALAAEDYQLLVLDNPHLEATMGLGTPLLSKKYQLDDSDAKGAADGD